MSSITGEDLVRGVVRAAVGFMTTEFSVMRTLSFHNEDADPDFELANMEYNFGESGAFDDMAGYFGSLIPINHEGAEGWTANYNVMSGNSVSGVINFTVVNGTPWELFNAYIETNFLPSRFHEDN